MEVNEDLFHKIFVEYKQLGYYSCEGINFFCSHYPNMNWHQSHKGSINIFGHCLDTETELLTTHGWKKFDEIKKTDKVYSLDKNEIKIGHIDNIIINTNYNEKFYEYDTTTISLGVTNLHRFVFFSKENNILYKTADKFFEEGGEIILTSAENKIDYNISDSLIRLYIQLVSDGSINKITNLCRLRVKKDRKIKIIETLLIALDIKFSKNYQKDNSCYFNFKLPNELKNFNIKGLDNKILNFSERQIDIIANEYSITDGYRNKNSIIIFTSKIEEIELLQHLFSINNYKTNKYSRVHGYSNNISYQLIITKNKKTLKYSNKYCFYKNNFKSYMALNKTVWCIKTTYGNFMCRRKGKTYFTGNCHNSYNHLGLGIDVGIDSAFSKLGEYRPFSALEVLELLKEKQILFNSHHNKNTN